jgi:hypothetical protein
MNTLAERTIEAHGGIKRWNELTSVAATELSGASRGIPKYLGRPT